VDRSHPGLLPGKTGRAGKRERHQARHRQRTKHETSHLILPFSRSTAMAPSIGKLAAPATLTASRPMSGTTARRKRRISCFLGERVGHFTDRFNYESKLLFRGQRPATVAPRGPGPSDQGPPGGGRPYQDGSSPSSLL